MYSYRECERKQTCHGWMKPAIYELTVKEKKFMWCRHMYKYCNVSFIHVSDISFFFHRKMHFQDKFTVTKNLLKKST